MANLYPENSQYEEASGPSKFPTLTKSVQSNIKTPPVSSPTSVSRYTAPKPTDLSGLYKGLGTIPAEKAIGERSNTITEKVPSGYSAFMPGQKNPQGQDMWVTPSDSTYVRNYPDALGGGQYAVDPTKPGAIVKSSRGYEPKETMLLRGGLSPYDVQIDHVIPLNMGGVDTLANKQVLSTGEHEQKTKAQAVALTLLAQGKISTDEAKSMTLNWKNYDVSDIPMPDSFGYITNLSVDKANSLIGAGTQKAKSEYYKLLGMDDLAEKTKKQWDFDVQHPKGTYGHSLGDSIKAVWKEIPTALSHFGETKTGEDTVAGEFGKGLVEGASAGLISATPEDGEKSIGKVSARIAGNALGTFIPIGLFARGLGLAGNVLSKVPGLSKVFSAPTSIINPLPWTAGAVDLAKPVSTIVPEVAGKVSIPGVNKIKETLGKINKFGKTTPVAEARTLGLQDIPMSLNKFGASRLKYGNMAKDAAFFGSYGLTTQLLREGMGVQDEGDFMNHAGTFVTEAITGGIMGNANQSFKGYAKIAAPAMILSYINGESPEDAFASAVTMVGLHGMGNSKIQRLGLTRDVTDWTGKKNGYIIKPGQNYEEVIAAEMNRVADIVSHGVLNQWAPSATKSAGGGTRKYTPKELERIQEEAIINIENKAYDEGWTPRQLDAELLKATASVRQLDKGGMGAIVRDQADIADIKSVAQKLNTTDQIRTIDGGTVPEFVHSTYGGKDPVELSPVNFNEKPSGDYSAVGIFPVTGYGSTIPKDGKAGGIRNNVEIFNKAVESKQAPYGDNILLVDRGNDYKNKMEVLNRTKTRENDPEFIPFKNPQNTVEAFGAIRLPDGKIEFIPLGFVARESRIQKMNEQVDLNGLIEYNKINNKDSLSEALRDNGVKAVWGRQVPLKTGLMTIAPKGKGKSQEYHLRVALTDGRWKDAVSRETSSKQDIVENPVSKTESVKTSTQNSPIVGEGFRPVVKDEILPNGYTTKINTQTGEKVTNAPIREVKATPKVEVKTTPGTEVKNISKTIEPEVSKVEIVSGEKDAKTEAPTKVESKQEKITKPKWREFILTGRGQEGVNAGVASYVSNPKDLKEFTRKNLTKIAKEVSNNGENIKEGWPKYVETITNKIRALTDNPNFEITNKKELRDLSWSYRHLANSGTRKEIIFNKGDQNIKIREGSSQNVGQLDKDIIQYNKKHGLPEDSMEIIHVGKKNIYEGVKNSLDSRNVFDHITKELQTLDKRGYTPLGIVAKGSDSIVYIKKEPKLVEDFNNNPSKYLNEGEKATDLTSDDKFMRVFAVDIAKWPKDATAGDFVKRANLNTHRYDVSNEDGTAKIHILKAKTIGEEPELKIDSSKFEDSTGEKAKKATESFLKGSEVDGKLIIGEKLFDRLVKSFDYDPTKHETGLKPLISGMVKGKDGEMIKMIQKGHAIKADPALRRMLETEYKLNLGEDEIASFDTNAKVGPKGDTHEIKISDIYSKPLSAGDEGRAKSSLERKFSNYDPEVTKDMLQETARRKKDFEAFNEEAMAANSKDKLEKVIEKYAERYNLDKDTLFYGPLGESFNLGAAKINLAHNLEKISKNMFIETVLSDNVPNSGRLFYSPSIKLPIDGPNKPLRYVKDDEVILGSEFMKKKNLKEGDKVLIMRDPSYDINNITVAKAIDGSKLGHESLGSEHAVVSHYNERVVHQADQDGDKMLIMKIGEGGVPERYANAIQKRGGLATPFTEVNVTKSGYITSGNIKEVIKNQLVGDDQTSAISVVNRVMDTLKENDITIKVYPSGPRTSKTKYDIISNGKVVDSGETFSSGEGFTVKPKWDKEERQLRSQALQEALDSKKSLDIVKRSEDNNPSWMLKQVFVDEEGNKIDNTKARAINRALKNVQKLFNIEKIAGEKNNLEDVFNELQSSFDMLKKMKNAGTKLTPIQEKWLNMSDVKTFRVPQETIIGADKLGVKNVRESLKDISLDNPKLTEIRRMVLKAKGEYNNKETSPQRKKEIKNQIEDFFLNNLEEGKYTQDEIDSISRWAATSNEANIKFDAKRFKEPKYVYKLNSIINASPRVAKAYYEGAESYEAPISESPTKYSNLANAIKKQP